MKVLVTGGRGFIGQYVVEELMERGHTPLIFDRRSDQWLMGNCIIGDIRDPIAINDAMSRVQGFIHLAGVLGTQETILNPMPAAMTNIEGGLNILQAAAEYDVPGVYIGVGNFFMNNTYSISKTTVERFVHMYNKERGTRINIVRAVNAYGPRQVAAIPYGPSRVRKITPSFICRALRNDPLEIYGDGEQISDMVYVSDVAKVLVQALTAAQYGETYDETIEVGPEQSSTVQEIAELIVCLSESDSEIIHIPMRPGEEPGARISADTSTMVKIMGNYPCRDFVQLEKGMMYTIRYFEELLEC